VICPQWITSGFLKKTAGELATSTVVGLLKLSTDHSMFASGCLVPYVYPAKA